MHPYHYFVRLTGFVLLSARVPIIIEISKFDQCSHGVCDSWGLVMQLKQYEEAECYSLHYLKTVLTCGVIDPKTGNISYFNFQIR